MATDRQNAANRKNAQKSTGPKTEEGKARSSQNAVRHGLTAETVVTIFENPEDYAAFETMVVTECEPQSALEHQLVARLTSLLWRLRRAVAIESGLFTIEANLIAQQRKIHGDEKGPDPLHAFRALLSPPLQPSTTEAPAAKGVLEAAQCFRRLTKRNPGALKRISRYEVALWRQAAQTISILNLLRDPRTNSLRPFYAQQRKWPMF